MSCGCDACGCCSGGCGESGARGRTGSTGSTGSTGATGATGTSGTETTGLLKFSGSVTIPDVGGVINEYTLPDRGVGSSLTIGENVIYPVGRAAVLRGFTVRLGQSLGTFQVIRASLEVNGTEVAFAIFNLATSPSPGSIQNDPFGPVSVTPTDVYRLRVQAIAEADGVTDLIDVTASVGLAAA